MRRPGGEKINKKDRENSEDSKNRQEDSEKEKETDRQMRINNVRMKQDRQE